MYIGKVQLNKLVSGKSQVVVVATTHLSIWTESVCIDVALRITITTLKNTSSEIFLKSLNFSQIKTRKKFCLNFILVE